MKLLYRHARLGCHALKNHQQSVNFCCYNTDMSEASRAVIMSSSTLQVTFSFCHIVRIEFLNCCMRVEISIL